MKQKISSHKGTLLAFFGAIALALASAGCGSLQVEKSNHVPKMEKEAVIEKKEVQDKEENTGLKKKEESQKTDHQKEGQEETEFKEKSSDESAQQVKQPKIIEKDAEEQKFQTDPAEISIPESGNVPAKIEDAQSEMTSDPIKQEQIQQEHTKDPAAQTKPVGEDQSQLKEHEMPKESATSAEAGITEKTETKPGTSSGTNTENTKSEQKTEEIPEQLDMNEIGDIFVSSEEYDDKVSNSEVGVAQ